MSNADLDVTKKLGLTGTRNTGDVLAKLKWN